MTRGWCVRVTVFDDLVVSISERELCGRELSEADKDLIRGCARHLLSFDGPGDLFVDALESVPAARRERLDVYEGICDGCAQGRSECLCDVDLDEVQDCNSPFHPGCRKCAQP